jgi:hypothetical protein
MGAVVRAAPDLPWFTPKLQNELLEVARFGLKTKWVALYCGVAPKALTNILDLGSRKDTGDPFRSFFRRWIKARAELMREKHELWAMGDRGALDFLKEVFPETYGKDAEPDYQPFTSVSNAEELEQLEAIIADPAQFGPDVLEMFRKHGRLKDGEA